MSKERSGFFNLRSMNSGFRIIFTCLFSTSGITVFCHDELSNEDIEKIGGHLMGYSVLLGLWSLNEKGIRGQMWKI